MTFLYALTFAASAQETSTVSWEVSGAAFVRTLALGMSDSPEATLFVLFTAEARLHPTCNIGGLF